MVEFQPSKLAMRVRFPLPAPKKTVALLQFFIIAKTLGIEKEGAKFRAGLVPAETHAKIVLWTIFLTRVRVAPLPAPSSKQAFKGLLFCFQKSLTSRLLFLFQKKYSLLRSLTISFGLSFCSKATVFLL